MDDLFNFQQQCEEYYQDKDIIEYDDWDLESIELEYTIQD